MALEAVGYTVVPLATEQCFDTPALSESFRIHAGPTRGQDLPRLLTKFEREF
ncbi:hypothetical protein I6B53_05325 [Schaalia sp. 19OD2882]|uniref:hypothetical protein n=1 Tax=Schaalia sp. 19OD2882 TaxID=2794089 RepID=UPI001C1EEC68|nr:hypothetical protein [Schaalia sp. 19OD2882]QWW20486.1 hypothetical protein I6B53_05325 [Schaalia sp. 19OD2882]